MLALGAGAVVGPFGAYAQPVTRTARIGFFYFGSRQAALESERYAAFIQGMRDLGYNEGRNLVIESRYADGNAALLPGLVAEMAKLNPEVIVATGSPIYRALQLSASTIPVVITVTVDPVAGGFAVSMAKPGGHFTGLTDTASDLNPKLLEFLMAAVPKLSRIGVLLHPDNVSHPEQLKKLMLVAQKTGLQTVVAEAGTADAIGGSFNFFARERIKAVIILNDTFFAQQLQQIAAQANKHKMASISSSSNYSQAGGLMNYGPNFSDNFRRAATFVDKILKGAKPAELPFEQPVRYYFTVNRKTAKSLGITLAQSLLISADKIIE